jgi:bacteriocin resistance YdeI/OmpD-like protein
LTGRPAMDALLIPDEVKTLITVLKGQIFLLGKDWDNLRLRPERPRTGRPPSPATLEGPPVMAREIDIALQAEEATALAPLDLLEALRMSDVWEVFCRLPEKNRVEFGRWIDGSSDQKARWRRIDALVLALRLSPLIQPEA